MRRSGGCGTSRVVERLVCDTTVAIRWLLEQAGHEHAREVLDRAAAGEVRLLAPTVMPWEAGNVLQVKGVRTGLLTTDDVVDALDVIGEICDLVDVDPRTVAGLAARLGTSFFDAAFGWVALDQRIPVLTADLRFARALGGRLSTVVLRGVGMAD